MWLLPLLLLSANLLPAESFVKREEVLTDEADQAAQFMDVAAQFLEVTDSLVGEDAPFTKLVQISTSLSALAGPAGIAFGVAGALIQLLGPTVPGEVEVLAEQLDSRFDEVDRKLKFIASQIGSLPTQNQINAQIHKLDEKEETFLNPLYQKYKDVSRSKANEHSIEDFNEQCGRKKPYSLVNELADAFAHQYRPGSASLFDDMIHADYPKDLIEKIRDRLLVDLTRSILMIPLCGAVTGWNQNWITDQVTWTSDKMKESIEKINTKIHNAFYRDTYELEFCFTKIAPKNSFNYQSTGVFSCGDGIFWEETCEFRFIVGGKFLIPGTADWEGLVYHFQEDVAPVRTDGVNALSKPICTTEPSITYDDDPKLYKALWKGTTLQYFLNVTEQDFGLTGDDDVLIPKKGSQNGKVDVELDNSRSKLMSQLGARTDVVGPESTTWTCEPEIVQTMCATIDVTWQFKRKITINPKA